MSLLLIPLLTLASLLAGAYAVAVFERWLAPGGRAGLALLAPLHEARGLLSQENLVPTGADRFLYRSAPLFALGAVSLAALVIPLGPGLVAIDMSVGLFYFIIILGPVVVALMNAGWASGARTGLFGTFRAAIHLVSYEVPIGFAALGPVMHAQSLSTVRIVEAQGVLWYVLWQPLGLFIYLVSALVMSYRRPFDVPLAGSELGGGVLAEHSGPHLFLFKLSLDALFVLLMAMGVVLFFGGWRGPWLPGWLWMALKTGLLSTLVLWVSRRLPRLRQDHVFKLSWKLLLPLSLLNVLAVGLLTFIVPGGI
ncbi:MAG TPA: complex I subunit 1 family protein [Myxococcaceae bacterium]|nr:complex I subunit 1 family protein [Myxococcaceae bacterium]